MSPLIPAAAVLAALGLGAPALARAQTPEPAAPVVLPAPDPALPPLQADPPPGKVLVPDATPPRVSTPGAAVARAEEAAAEDQGRGGRGGTRGGRGRGASGGNPRGPIVVARPPAGRGWWGGGAVHLARPYYYDPFWATGAFGWSPLYYAPWSLMWSTAGFGPYPYFGSTTFNTGAIRLKVKPRDAQVFVDGFYAGEVDDFDGIFQSLRLAPGGHKIEVRMPGFETLVLDVHIQPDRTITWTERLRETP